MNVWRQACGWLCVLWFIGTSAALAFDAKDRHVVVICVDGLPAYLLNDPSVPLPAIRGLAKAGLQAQGMVPANPSVTWPNHTSMTTGVWPDRHGVLFNGVLERPGPGLPVAVNPRKDKAELMFAPTLYDVMHEHGFSTAAINWPCTRNCATLDDNFPDVPESLDHTTPRLIEELQQAGALAGDYANFNKGSALVRDVVWTEAACRIIRHRKPNLLYLHLLNVDGTHHKYGPETPAGNTAVAYADTFVGEVLEAIDEAGIREQTTVFIVSDHGFMAIPKTLQPNVLLRQAGLLTVEGSKVTTARVHAVPEGGIAMVYLTRPETRDKDLSQVIQLFRDQEGIAEVLLPDQFAKYGLPQPADYPQMADMVLAAKDGYGFSGAATGEDFVVKSEGTLGTHGFLSNNERMLATFVASGKGVRQGEPLGIVENIDLAPTIAKLFGVTMESAAGKVLELE
ncbi:MAG: alkaline phosphatase family protein [Planctomycetales bacterium 12-60-4]|nr:MAG: alkaline phosphatase family protein [Planctomycetales bacterium 12-60-4]